MKPGAPDWNRTNCPPVKSRVLILMSFEREPISFLAAHNGLTPVRFTQPRTIAYALKLGGSGESRTPAFLA
jgi:hypothetical protein